MEIVYTKWQGKTAKYLSTVRVSRIKRTKGMVGIV
jgi:hypothetical protein